MSLKILTVGAVFAGETLWAVTNKACKTVPTFPTVATWRRRAQFLLLLATADGAIVIDETAMNEWNDG